MITVFAMPEELSLLGDRYVTNNTNVYIKTGVGASNVINALKNIDRSEHIHNIGYAGSNSIPIGTKVRVGKVSTYHPNTSYDEPIYTLDGDVKCYTSNDFVLQTEIEEPCVFDMELAYICAMGFRKVTAEKIVSDNMDLKQFEESIEGR